jgi:hypothetical protein
MIFRVSALKLSILSLANQASCSLYLALPTQLSWVSCFPLIQHLLGFKSILIIQLVEGMTCNESSLRSKLRVLERPHAHQKEGFTLKLTHQSVRNLAFSALLLFFLIVLTFMWCPKSQWEGGDGN